jgi:serine protease inhibitor ecotin
MTLDDVRKVHGHNYDYFSIKRLTMPAAMMMPRSKAIVRVVAGRTS